MKSQYKSRYIHQNEYRAILDDIYKVKLKSEDHIRMIQKNNSTSNIKKNSTTESWNSVYSNKTNLAQFSSKTISAKEDLNDVDTLFSFYKIDGINFYNDKNRWMRKSSYSNKDILDKIEATNKFGIKGITQAEKFEIEKVIKKKDVKTPVICRVKPVIIDKLYDDPVSSYREIKINKSVFDKINDILIKNQINKYSEIINNIDNKSKYKKLRMKSHNLENPNKSLMINIVKDEDEKNNVIKQTRDEYFSMNNILKYVYMKKKLAPASRSFSSLVYHKDTDLIILFAGLGANRYDDIWLCYSNDYNWKKVDHKNLPSKRSGHTSIIYKSDMIIYGGIIEENDIRYCYQDYLLVFNIYTKKFKIISTSDSNKVPWRRNHISVGLSNYMLIHGGTSENDIILNDICILELNRFKWLSIKIYGTVPSLTNHSSCIAISKEKTSLHNFNIFKQYETFKLMPNEGIYLFGGISKDLKYNNDLYVIKIGKPFIEIEKVEFSGQGPSERSDCSMNFYENLKIIILHGGKNEANYIFYNDTYIFDIVKLKWIRVNIYNENKIEMIPRSGHSSIIQNNKLIIYGGNNSVYIGSDLLIFSLNFTNKYELSTDKT